MECRATDWALRSERRADWRGRPPAEEGRLLHMLASESRRPPGMMSRVPAEAAVAGL